MQNVLRRLPTVLQAVIFCCFVTVMQAHGDARHAAQVPQLALRGAHFDMVRAVAFSPDGALLASGSDDNSIKLWSTRTGQAVRILIAPAGGVNAVAFSSNGKMLATGCSDKTIRLWSVRSGRLLRTLSGHSAAVNAVAFSPNGQTLASASSDKAIKLWDVERGREMRTLSGHTSWVSSVAFSPDGRILASGGWDKTVRLWDAATGKELRVLGGQGGRVMAVAFNRRGRLLAGASGQTIVLWDAATGKELRVLNGPADQVTAVAFGSDTMLAGGSADHSVALWDSGSGKLLRAPVGIPGTKDPRILAYLWYWQGKAEGADMDKAVASFRRAIALDPKKAAYVLSLAGIYQQNAQFAVSQELLQSNLKTLPGAEDRKSLRLALADTHTQWAQSLAEKQDYAAALDHYKAALEIDAPERHPQAAMDLYGSGLAYEALNRFEEANGSYQQALALFHEVRDRENEAALLNNLGAISGALSRYDQSVEYCQQALSISRDLQDQAGEGTALANLGLAHLALSQYDRAIENFQQALVIKREGGDRTGEGMVLNNLGLARESLAQYAEAIEYYGQALTIQRELEHRKEVGAILNNLGASYHYLGSYAKAIEYYEQALVIQRELKQRREEGNTLSNLGHAHFYLNQYETAIGFYEQALALRRAVQDRAGEGVTLGNLALASHALGHYDIARTQAEQALGIAREIKDREGEGNALNEIGLILLSQQRYPEAVQQFERALAILREVGARALEGKALHNLMLAWKAQGKTSLAIFYGKQAVNVAQAIRADIQNLDKDLQKGFVTSKQDTYRELADLLIEQGRLPEAQQVLDMLKEEEYFQFVRRDSTEVASATAQAALSPAEADWEKRYREIGDKVTAIGAERGALLAKASRTPEEEQRLAKLEEDLAVANQAFQQFLDKLSEEAGSSKAPEKADQLREAQGLMEDLRELGSGAVALYTLVGEDKYRVVLITPDAQKAAEYPIKAADLNRKVLQFRQALQNPEIDPIPLAQELYKILVGPIEKDLEGAKAETLMWSLDGILRYLPMPALHDGKKYLVERYRNTVFTPASQSRLKDRSTAEWKALGFGVSKAHEGFIALPGVVDELKSIIYTSDAEKAAGGVLPGLSSLDDAFTEDAMKSALRKRYPVVHIASHFQFQPGNETDSFLLLGDGSHLSLEEIKRLPNVFGGVEVLTLSACNTATGGSGADGKEVEGFGVLAQRQGAKTILATLWPLSDESAKLMMPEFYRLRQAKPDMLKAEALRQAQIELLKGDLKGTAPSGSRGSRLATEDSAEAAAGQKPFKFDPNVPYAHPHFWAPFILIGNWR
jgi:CHAT domain-containing protein/WD40 repeat protein